VPCLRSLAILGFGLCSLLGLEVRHSSIPTPRLGIGMSPSFPVSCHWDAD
jgi:hypothetical protein